MPVSYDWRGPVWNTFLSLPLGLIAERSYASLPKISERCPSAHLPSLTVIIPARNEESNLSLLLPQLQQLIYPGDVEILVVNDNSTDTTSEVARRYGVKLIDLSGGVSPGWLGKPFACHQGALAAHGEWLLFTDADTKHSPTGPARCVEFACRNSLDGLSLFIRQECTNLLDRLVLSAAYAGLFAGYQRGNHLLNGQYILIRREVYRESGGFAAVRGHVLEDVALGYSLARQGYRTPVLHGESVAAVRMYDSRRQMFEGITRLGSEWMRYAGAGVLATGIFITSILSPLIVLVGVLRGKVRLRWLIPTWGASSLAMAPWYRRFGSAWLAMLAPFGALLVLVTAIWGLGSRLTRRGIPWKGRMV